MNTLRLAITALACTFVPVASYAFFAGNLPATVEEYVNDITGHYFLASQQFEKDFIDAGHAGPGWHRTGYQFGAHDTYGTIAPGYQNYVCRFYAPSPNAHFYTASDYECSLLRAHPEWGWIDEGVHFIVELPRQGGCAASEVPVVRLYNNRFIYNDSSHRFVWDPSIRAQLVASGWIDEGVVFCATWAAFVPPG